MTDQTDKKDIAVSLHRVTFETVRPVSALSVSPSQTGLVAPNAISIAEAYFEKGAWFRSIHADNSLAGFVMLFDPTMPDASDMPIFGTDAIVLWRLMVDHRFQGQGVGKKVLKLVVEHARQRPGIRKLLVSYIPREGGPEGFYAKFGFEKTGRLVDDGREVEMVLAL